MIIITRKRPAHNRFEVDALPPFGKSEVIIVGQGAKIAAVIVALAIAYSYQN